LGYQKTSNTTADHTRHKNGQKLINTMQSFGVTCFYDEILRFRRSAARAATEQRSSPGIVDGATGLIQVVADNFDVDISSQIGKLIHWLC